MLIFMVKSQNIYVIFQTATILVIEVIVFLSFTILKGYTHRMLGISASTPMRVWVRGLSPSLSTDGPPYGLSLWSTNRFLPGLSINFWFLFLHLDTALSPLPAVSIPRLLRFFPLRMPFDLILAPPLLSADCSFSSF
jgi:hypothetical protein